MEKLRARNVGKFDGVAIENHKYIRATAHEKTAHENCGKMVRCLKNRFTRKSLGKKAFPFSLFCCTRTK